MKGEGKRAHLENCVDRKLLQTRAFVFVLGGMDSGMRHIYVLTRSAPDLTKRTLKLAMGWCKAGHGGP